MTTRRFFDGQLAVVTSALVYSLVGLFAVATVQIAFHALTGG